MKKIFLIFLLFLPVIALGRGVPSLTGPVVDEAHLLSSDQKQALENSLSSFYSKTGKQIQLVILKSLEGDALEDFSIRLAEAWKIGKKGSDSGVILLIAYQDHSIRIEVGGGLEGELTDAESGRIISFIVPYFKKGDYVSGIYIGLNAIAQKFGGKLEGAYSTREIDFDSKWFKLFFFILFLVLYGSFSGFGYRRRRLGSGFYWGGGGFSGGGSFGGFGGGGFGGGGWSGGGGGFSGGGASGRW